MFSWWKKKGEKPKVENIPLETDIALPDLKKKEQEEKKKTGAAPAIKGKPGDIFIPAKGGAGAARGAASAARGAASGAAGGAEGASAVLFGRLLTGGAVLLLKTLLVGAGLVAIGGAVVVGARMAAAPPRKSPLTFDSFKTEAKQTSEGLAREVMSAAKQNSMFAWIVPEAAKGGKAGTAASAGKSGKTDGSGEAGDAGATEGSGPVGETDPTMAGPPTNPFATPGGSQLSTNVGGSVTSANFVLPGPKYGAVLNARMSRFENKSASKGKAGAISKNTVVMSPSMGNIRHRMRDSRSLGRLRAMAPYNARIKGSPGSTYATEAQAGAADTQFEGTENVGGVAPESPPDGTGTTSPSPPGGPGAPTGCQCNWEKQTCVNNQCVDLGKPGPTETTPWKKLTEKGKSLQTQVIIFMVLAAVFFTIGYYIQQTYVGSIWATIFMALGYIMALLAIVKAYQMIQVGKQINGMGGKPHGDQFINMGYAYIVGAIAMMAMAYFQPGWASAIETFAIVMVAIMIICTLVGSMLK